MKALFWWPVMFAAIVLDSCYEVFWYCVITGRPAWMKDKDLMRGLANILRSTK